MPLGSSRRRSGATEDLYSITLPAADQPRQITGLQLETLPTGNNFVITRMVASIVPAGATGLKGRYVRVELPGDGKMLSLAEVQVFSGHERRPDRRATQSSTDFDGPPQLAIDGNTNGEYAKAKSTTHTAASKDPWWEVDLKASSRLERDHALEPDRRRRLQSD